MLTLRVLCCGHAVRATLLQVRQLEMERFSMSKALEGGDKAAAARIKALDKQLNELKKDQGVRAGVNLVSACIVGS